MIDYMAKINAQDVIHSIHDGASEDTIAFKVQQMVLYLNGQPHVFERLSADGRLLYIIALLVAQS